MTINPISADAERSRSLSASAYFSLCLGAIVGVGWLAVAGPWIEGAGPVGTSLAFLLAVISLLPVAAVYALLGAKLPRDGGAIIYLAHAFGPQAAYLTGVLILISFLSALMFFAILGGQLVSDLLPLVEGPVLYDVAGYEVRPGFLLPALIIATLLAWVNAGSRLFVARIQSAALLSMLVVVGGLAMLAAGAGQLENMRPLFGAAEDGAVAGMLAVFVVAPWFLSGFEAIAQSLGEQRIAMTPRQLAVVLIASIVGAFVFYVVIIAATASLMPRDVIGNGTFATVEAFDRAFLGWSLGKFVLGLALLGLLTSWNGFLFASLRTFEAMADRGDLPRVFRRTGAGQPAAAAHAACWIAAASGVLMGENALLPVLAAGALSTVLVFVAVCGAATVMARRGEFGVHRASTKSALCGLATAATVSFAVLVVAAPVIEVGGLPPEWGIVAILIGLAFAARAFTPSLSTDPRH